MPKEIRFSSASAYVAKSSVKQMPKEWRKIYSGILTQTNRGKECLVGSGFEYKKGKVVNGGANQFWRCIKCICNGSAKTSFGSLEGLAKRSLPKTNNAMEGWHKGFNAHFRKAHMSLSQFIIRLKSEEEKTRQMVVRARVNPAEVLRHARRPEYVKREANLKLLVQRYQPEQKIEFLKSVQHHLAEFPLLWQNEIGEEPVDETLF